MAAHQQSACNELWIIKQMARLCRSPTRREISARATTVLMAQEKEMLFCDTGRSTSFYVKRLIDSIKALHLQPTVPLCNDAEELQEIMLGLFQTCGRMLNICGVFSHNRSNKWARIWRKPAAAGTSITINYERFHILSASVLTPQTEKVQLSDPLDPSD